MGEAAHKYEVPTKLAPRELDEKDVIVDLNNLKSPADVYEIDDARYAKAARALNLLDQSSAPIFAAGANSKIIEENVTRSIGGGGQYAMTVKAYKDTLPAFSEYLSFVSEKGDSTKLFRVIESFLTYQAIMANRERIKMITDMLSLLME